MSAMDTIYERQSATSGPGTSDAPVYSVVAPVFDEEQTLPHFYRRVAAVMEALGEPFELVLVNDGSRDGTYALARALCERDPRLRLVDLSRNFGHQLAISAGMARARGQAVILIDSDLQDPPEVIPELVARWKAGAEVVYAQRRRRAGETRFKRLTAKAFYRLLARLTSASIPPDTGDFRLLDRRVVDALVAMPEHHRFLRGMSAWVGFRQAAVPYDRQERFAGRSKYPLRAMLRLASDAITGFSAVPLQLVGIVGFLLTAASLLGASLAAASRLFAHAAVATALWTWLLVLFVGGVQLLALGIVATYLGRVYDEVRRRPLYVVRDVLQSPAARPEAAPARITERDPAARETARAP